MTNVTVSIVTAEIVCAIMMFIVGYAIFTEKKKTLPHKYFGACIASVFTVLLSDSFSYIFEANNFPTIVIFLDNLLTMVAADFLMVFFSLYVWSLISEKEKSKKLGKTILYIEIIICILDFIFEIYGGISGKTFVIINNKFNVGPLYDVSFIVQLIILLLNMIYLISNKNIIGIKTILIFGVYYFFPVIAIFIIIYNPDLSFICSSIAASFLVIYIGIEKERESKDIILSQLINTDILTGLNNRNAYEERIKKYTKDTNNEQIGVVFSDLNLLKKVNDELGHSAGDQYIIKFSEILKESFNKDSIFRISGDEFIIILNNLNEDEIEHFYYKYITRVINENRISSNGLAIGKANDIVLLIKKAEDKMYEDKEDYYIKNKINRRHTSS